MNADEKVFLEHLTALSDEDLESWVRVHHTGISYTPRAPFISYNDPMDIPEWTLKLLNTYYRINTDIPLLYRFENVLVNLFGREAIHPFYNPGLIFKYIYLFTNIPPRGNARQRLTELLLPILSQKEWISLRVGSRNLHYDALELVIQLYRTEEKPLLFQKTIDDYLISALPMEKSARFCSIALGHFCEIRKIGTFFSLFDQSFEMLSEENIDSLIDQVILFHLKDRSLSFGYLADWLSSKQISSGSIEKKLMKFYKNMDLFSLITDRWKENKEEYLGGNRREGRYLIALLIQLQARYKPGHLGPDLIRVFFENEQFYNMSDILQEKRHHYLMEGDLGRKEIKELLNNRDVDKPAYVRVHIGTLISLVSVIGSMDNFALNPSVDLLISIEDFPEHCLVISNVSGKMVELTAEEAVDTIKIPTAEIPGSFQWWEIVELCA